MAVFADAHAHPAEMAEPYPDYAGAAAVLGVTSRPCEWDSLRDLDNPRLFRFYGVHPWYCGDWDAEAESRLKAMLAEDPRSGIGEIGLDTKRGTVAEQLPSFEAQLRIAAELGRPVEVHTIRAEKEVLDALRASGLRSPAVLHSFGSESYSKPFADLGCYMSLNPRILSRSATRISRLVSSIPEDRLLLETDAPFVPEGFAGMADFAERLSDACGIPAERLLELSYDNIRVIIGERDRREDRTNRRRGGAREAEERIGRRVRMRRGRRIRAGGHRQGRVRKDPRGRR